MALLTTVLLFFVAITLHELGHAVLMRRYGVAMQQIRLFGLGPRLCTFRWRKVFGETPLTLSFIPLGAFVQPEKEDALSRLEPRQREHILSGGIAVNFIFGAVLIVLSLWNRMNALIRSPMILIIGFAFISFLCGIALWRSPRRCGSIVLVIGALMLCVLAYILASLPVMQSIAGPVGIAKEISLAETMAHALFIGGALSLNLGLFNALPFTPLDGGQIALSKLRSSFPAFMGRHGKAVTAASAAGLMIILFLALGTDAVRIWQMF